MEYVPGISNIAYFCGTDEYGRSEAYHLCDWQLEYTYDGGTMEESSKIKKDIAIDFYNALEEILERYGVKSWIDLEKSDVIISDGKKRYLLLNMPMELL